MDVSSRTNKSCLLLYLLSYREDKEGQEFPKRDQNIFIARSLALSCLCKLVVFHFRMDGFFLPCYLVGEKRMSCTSLIKRDYYITSVRLTCTIWALGHLL